MAASAGGGAAPAPAGPPSDYEPYLEVALAAAKEAGAVIAQAWNQTKKIDTKSGEGQLQVNVRDEGRVPDGCRGGCRGHPARPARGRA